MAPPLEGEEPPKSAPRPRPKAGFATTSECPNALEVVNFKSCPYPGRVSKKSQRIAALIGDHRGHQFDPHYLGYFTCFNQGLYYEAHDVLEELWLADRRGPLGDFYKGLIQFAGAFVHLQKNRLRPAAALFKLALNNLEKYPRLHEHLNVATTCELARKWLEGVERARFDVNPLTGQNAPALRLESEAHER